MLSTRGLGKEMTYDWTDDLAKRQLGDYRDCQPGTFFGDKDCRAIELSDAYRVSIKLSELRRSSGDRPIGYKIGCTSPGIYKAFGIRGPVMGFLYEEEMQEYACKLKSTNFYNLAIEAEMAIRVGQDLQVESVFPIIELHNFEFRGETNTLQELVANNCFNAGIVMPDKITNGSGAECANLRLEINGNSIEEGSPWCFASGPDGSLEWITEKLSEHDLELKPGNIVLAGTNLGIHRVRPGDHIAVYLNGKLRVESEVVS
tara:strand:- start:12569 stop:13345 length:777 start_codon:yes stop_codon:yes gene_type:complete